MKSDDDDMFIGFAIALMFMSTLSFTVAGFIYYGAAGGFAVFGGCCFAMAILAPLTSIFKD